jgi:hypothetical protein
MVGKNGAVFPMIGKIFRVFSNDWKQFSGENGWMRKNKQVKKGTK